MAMPIVAYDTLKIAPFDMKLHEVRLTQKIDDHGRLNFTGIIPEEKEDQYVRMASEQTVIELMYTDEKGINKTLFHGKILRLNVKVERGVYWIDVEAVSHSYDMDIMLVNRAFQDKSMKIEKVVKEIAAPYKASINNMYSEQMELGGFTLQYQETDWQFMKRLASHYHAPLVTVSSRDTISVYLGIPDHRDLGEIEATHYRVHKDLLTYKSLGDPKQTGLNERDFICYEVVMDQVLELGDKVTFKNQKLHVFEVHTEMNRGVLTHKYILCHKEAGYKKVQYNTKIVGASIQGKVAAVVRDEVKVKLEFDHEWSQKTAYLFPYSTMYASEDQTGWYAMPEVGDDVRINFPSAKEAEGIALSTVRKKLPPQNIATAVVKQEKVQPIIDYSSNSKDDMMANPNNKFLLTTTGQKIMFEEDKITISAGENGSSITLTNAGTIILNSSNKIAIQTGKQVSINADNIMMNGNYIEMSTENDQAGITINQGQVIIKGVEVLMEK